MIPDTARAVLLPDAIATATSAARSARTSLVPSPTIATKCLCSCSAPIIRAFCAGAIRPKMLCSSTACAKPAASNRSRSAPEISPPFGRIGNCRTRAATVCGLSPLIILGSIPSSAIIPNVSVISGRNASASVTSPAAVSPSSPACGSGRRAASAHTTARRPFATAVSYSGHSDSAFAQWGSTLSGAPRTNVRRSLPSANWTALHRRSELNGTPPDARAPLDHRARLSARARAVLLSSAVATLKAPSQPSSPSPPSAQWTLRSRSALAVIVPVLSKHTTST